MRGAGGNREKKQQTQNPSLSHCQSYRSDELLSEEEEREPYLKLLLLLLFESRGEEPREDPYLAFPDFP